MVLGWDELVVLVRQWQEDSGLDTAEHEAALALTMRLGRFSLPGTLGCSVTMADRDSHFRTPVSDGALALRLDQAQYTSGRGPCLSAARHDQIVLVPALAGDRRWPELASQAVAKGVRTTLSLPLAIEGSPAALNFYGGDRVSYAEGRSTAVAGLVAKCTTALLSTATRARVAADPRGMPELAARRALIDRAVRVVMDRDKVGPTTAYRWLGLQTASRELPLMDVVNEILT